MQKLKKKPNPNNSPHWQNVNTYGLERENWYLKNMAYSLLFLAEILKYAMQNWLNSLIE